MNKAWLSCRRPFTPAFVRILSSASGFGILRGVPFVVQFGAWSVYVSVLCSFVAVVVLLLEVKPGVPRTPAVTKKEHHEVIIRLQQLEMVRDVSEMRRVVDGGSLNSQERRYTEQMLKHVQEQEAVRQQLPSL